MTDSLPVDALSTAFPWLQEASDTDPRHVALRPIAWEHTEACGCAECRPPHHKRAGARGGMVTRAQRNLPASRAVVTREKVTT